MAVLVVMEQGVRIHREGEELVLDRQGKLYRRARLTELEEVILAGKVEITSGAVHACLRLGIDVVWITLNGRYRGMLSGPESRLGARRLAQYRAVSDPTVRMRFAAAFVQGKVINQRAFLLRHQRELKSLALHAAVVSLRALLPKIELAGSIAELMGYEGQASALYFGVLPELIRNRAFTFRGRSRRPPKDEVNAALSYGYALLLSRLQVQVRLAGLDPAIGILHEPFARRPSLALDLLEEFRPWLVDRLVLRLINRRQLAPADFEPYPATDVDAILAEKDGQSGSETARVKNPGIDVGTAPESEGDVDGTPEQNEASARQHGIYLADTGRRILISAYLRRLRQRIHYPPRGGSYEIGDILDAQVRLLAGALERTDRSYVPFTPR